MTPWRVFDEGKPPFTDEQNEWLQHVFGRLRHRIWEFLLAFAIIQGTVVILIAYVVLAVVHERAARADKVCTQSSQSVQGLKEVAKAIVDTSVSSADAIIKASRVDETKPLTPQQRKVLEDYRADVKQRAESKVAPIVNRKPVECDL